MTLSIMTRCIIAHNDIQHFYATNDTAHDDTFHNVNQLTIHSIFKWHNDIDTLHNADQHNDTQHFYGAK